MPLGHGSRVVSAGFEPAISTMSGWRALRCSTRLNSRHTRCAVATNAARRVPTPVGPAGVEPAYYRVSDGCLAARSPARKTARLVGFEPTGPVLETGCSPRSTTLSKHLAVQPARCRSPHASRRCHRSSKRKGWESNPQGLAAHLLSRQVPSPLGSPFQRKAVPVGLEPTPISLTGSRTTVVLRDKRASRGI